MAQDLCRICLNFLGNQEITFNIFTQHSWETSYASKITAVANIQVIKSDGLPENICSDCAKRVDDSFQLKEQVERSEDYLRSLSFEVKKVKTEDELIDETVVKCEDVSNNCSMEHQEQLSEGKIESLITKSEPAACSSTRVISGSESVNLGHTEHNEPSPSNKKDESKISVELEGQHYEIREVQEESVEGCKNKEDHEKMEVKATSDSKDLNETHCTICGKEIKSKRWYNFHMRRHNGERFYKCDNCSRSFFNKEILKRHMKLHGSSEKGFQCNICEATFSREATLAKHKATVHNVGNPKIYPCDVCGRNFNKKGFLEKHKSTYHDSDKFKHLSCDICNLAFSHKGILTRHKGLVHNIKRQPDEILVNKECTDSDSNQSESTASDSSRQSIIDCKDVIKKDEENLPECIQVSQQQSTSITDEALVPKTEPKGTIAACQEESSSVLPENVVDVDEYSKETLHKEFITMGPIILKQYQCNICGRTMKSRSWLRIHIRMHSTEGAHKCETCGKSFYSQSRLKNHEKTHTGQKAAECFICFKKFSQLGHLRHHIRSVHDGETPYKCNLCSKAFRAKNSLKNHITAHHIAERNFACSECNKTFLRRDTLKKHMETHKTVKDICNICGIAFGQKGAIEQHKRIAHNMQIESQQPASNDKNDSGA